MCGLLVSRYRTQMACRRKASHKAFTLLCVHVIRYQLAKLIKATCYTLDISGSLFGRCVRDVSLEGLYYPQCFTHSLPCTPPWGYKRHEHKTIPCPRVCLLLRYRSYS
jgi:hypothetical protein